MRGSKIPFLSRFVKEDRGQTAAIVTVMMVVLIALSALGIETGHVYYAYRLLQVEERQRKRC